MEGTRKFVQSIARRRDRVREDFDSLRFSFLLNKLATGLTLARLALGLPRRSEKRMRYTSKARNICDSVAHLSRTSEVKPEEREQLYESFVKLREAIETLDADL